MAYISKRDAQPKTDGPAINYRKKNLNQEPSGAQLYDNLDDDLDGEDDLDEDNDTFLESLNTEFPLSGGETDEDD